MQKQMLNDQWLINTDFDDKNNELIKSVQI